MLQDTASQLASVRTCFKTEQLPRPASCSKEALSLTREAQLLHRGMQNLMEEAQLPGGRAGGLHLSPGRHSCYPQGVPSLTKDTFPPLGSSQSDGRDGLCSRGTPVLGEETALNSDGPELESQF